MTDLFAFTDTLLNETSEPEVFSVGSLASALKRNIENSFAQVTVEGEISSLKMPGSGHIYFNLQDQKTDAVINCILWKSHAHSARNEIKEGQLVRLRARVTTYPPRSQYQLDVQTIKPAGLGALLQLLEERKKKLAAEGLFDPERKRPLPFLPQHIGIITSPTGAVISDMLHRITARCPRNVWLWPVTVQGEQAPTQIIQALQQAQAFQPQLDVIILARGGGSVEDLMAFNDEDVIRAVAGSAIPVVTGVGHEPDHTLVDYVADVRASTPTAAAELVVPYKPDLLNTIQHFQQRLGHIAAQSIRHHKLMLANFENRLPDPARLLGPMSQQLDERSERLHQAMQQYMRHKADKLASTMQTLQALSPEAPLRKGYVYITDNHNLPVKSATTTADSIQLHFQDGIRKAKLI